MSTAVVTYCDALYGNHLSEVFLPTLRSAGAYQGKVIILDYGLTASQKSKCRKYEVEFAEGRGGQMPEARYRDIAVLLKNDICDTAMLIDSGDVWFQSPINPLFAACAGKVGVTYEGMARDDTFLQNALNAIAKEMQITTWIQIKERPNYSSGMTVGDRDLIRKLSFETAGFLEYCGCRRFGIVQVAYNFTLSSLHPDNILELDDSWDYVLVSRLKDGTLKFCDQTHPPTIFDRSGMHKVPIVHNAGGKDWRVFNYTNGRFVANPRWQKQ